MAARAFSSSSCIAPAEALTSRELITRNSLCAEDAAKDCSVADPVAEGMGNSLRTEAGDVSAGGVAKDYSVADPIAGPTGNSLRTEAGDVSAGGVAKDCSVADP